MSSVNATSNLPVLLLIPGMLNTARIWSRVAPLLQGMADIRIADVTRQTSIADMAHDAWTLVSDLPATRRLVVCGFSMGGYVALELARVYLHGKRADSSWALGLLNTSAAPEMPDGLVAREKTIKAIERDFERVIQGIALFGLSKAHHTDADLMTELLAIMRQAGADCAITQLRAIMQRRDQRPTLQSFAAQVLVMASQDDLVVPPAASQDMAALLSSARLEWLSPAGHMTPLEQAAQVAVLLKTML
jgi:pimeloyl-ACP methyl ester carboxylesterase